MTRYGCDPELLLWESEVYSRGGMQWAENREMGLETDGVFGVDGARAAAELRPKPCDTVEGIVTMIGATLKLGMESGAGKFAWSGGTGKSFHPIGGHMHLSLEGVTGLSARQFARLLDTYVGIPMLALEPGRGRRQRRDEGYGMWSDYREADWGYGIEYRTTASWLVSPVITRMAFALAAMVMEHPNPGSIQQLVSLENQQHMNDTPWLKRQARKCIREMRTWPDYLQFRNYIEPWHIYDQVLGTWVEERDIRQTWKLLPEGYVPPNLETRIGVASTVHQKSDIQYNRSHRGLREMARAIGPKVSPTRKTMWVTGASGRRGDNYRLSPSLAALPRVREYLRLNSIGYEKWRPFPESMTGYVVAVPMAARATDSLLNEANQTVQAIANIALERN